MAAMLAVRSSNKQQQDPALLLLKNYSK